MKHLHGLQICYFKRKKKPTLIENSTQGIAVLAF
jgi:hypothetical protein